MKNLRIFISSPGDVQQERMIAKRVIAELGRVYQDYITLDPILWEDLPLEATGSFQGGIDYFLKKAPIDIAVFILWSRLGTKLGSSFRKEDGSEYDSGTEYEFDMMYTLWKRTQRPKLMVYVKDSDPQYTGTSSHIKMLIDQKDKLDKFIEEKFRDRETGTNYAYWQFDKQQTFEERLRTHLTRLIKDQIGDDVSVREWEGNPYVGLRSYTIDESAIFCGRKGLIYDITSKLLSDCDTGNKPSLFILGESGSGKSSLIKAGVLPQLMETSLQKRSFCTEILTPSVFRGHVYDSIVGIVLKYFPSLIDNPVASDLTNGIPEDYDFKYLRHALNSNTSAQVPILFIDQFEEIFTDNLITDEERRRSLHLLRGLCETRQIFLVFSMRNDFYSRFTSYPELGLIKNLSYVVDIPNVTTSDISEIVEEPARKANKRWGRNDKGFILSKKIIEDASRLQSLPLIEFALSELYKECADDEEMSFEAYDRIGCLSGAVVQYANNFYSSLSSQEQDALKSILGAVITVSNDQETLFVRKISVRSNIEKTDAQKSVVQRLINAHLFVSDKDADGNPTVSFVHEILLGSWSVVKEWCQLHKDFLNRNDHYEKLARYWKSNGCQKTDLIHERSALLEAEYFMFHHECELQPDTYAFLNKSLVRQRRKGIVKHVFGFIGSLILLLLLLAAFYNDSIRADLMELFGYDSFSLYDVFSISIPIMAVAAYAVYLRVAGKFKYKTIFASTVFWAVIVGIVVALSLYELFSGKIVWYGLFWSVPFVFCGISVFMDFHKRNLWKKNIYKPYLIADRVETTKGIVSWSFVGLCVVFILAVFGIALDEKNERYENTLDVADELFTGLNNISTQLSWSDILYINKMHMNYLVERFSDELWDTIPDKRELQYATCLYNLHAPFEALSYLYPDNFWDHNCLFVLASSKAGMRDLAEFYLEQYVEGHRLNDIGWVTTTKLIMTAEILGRFDLADSLYNIMGEKKIDWSKNIDDLVNFGHISLMKGDVSKALSIYSVADSTYISQNPLIISSELKNKIKESIANDFTLFRWLGVGNHDCIDEASNKLGINIRQFYTNNADSLTTDEIHARLVGNWAMSDSSIVLKIHQNVPTCQYKWFVYGNEYLRKLTNCRFSKNNGHIFWEEFDHDDLSICSGEIIALSDSEFSVKILENGVKEDKGKIRTFYRVPNDG